MTEQSANQRMELEAIRHANETARMLSFSKPSIRPRVSTWVRFYRALLGLK